MIDVIIAMGIGVLIGAFGVIAWALSAANKVKRMIEINNNKRDKVTDQEVAKAVDTIRKYCDSHDCTVCVIEEVCEEYFDYSNEYPYNWPEMEVPE